MKTLSLRLCAPCVLAAVINSTALSASAIAQKLSSDFGLEPGTDYGFAIENGQLQMIVANESTLDKLAGIPMPTIDANASDQRFFKKDDDGRIVAAVTFEAVQPLVKGVHFPKRMWSKTTEALVRIANAKRLPLPARESAGARPEAA